MFKSIITAIALVITASAAQAWDVNASDASFYKMASGELGVKFSDNWAESTNAMEYECTDGNKVYTLEVEGIFKIGFKRGTIITLTGSNGDTNTFGCTYYLSPYTSSNNGEEVELDDGRTGTFYED